MLERRRREAATTSRRSRRSRSRSRTTSRLRDYLFTPEPVAQADFFVNCPKFKAHPWTTVTFSMKNYIGIQDDRHRLIDHDHQLNEKIADLQYIIQPQFIAIDAHHRRRRPHADADPVRRSASSSWATTRSRSTRCAATIIGVDPHDASITSGSPHERGFGPTDLVEDRDHRRRHARGGAGAREGLQGRPHPRREVLRGHEHHRVRRPAARGRGTATTAGAAARARSRRRSRSCACSTRRPTRRCRACTSCSARTRARSTPSPARRSSSSATAPTGRASIARQAVAIESLYKDRSTLDPHTAKHEDIFAKLATTEARSSRGDVIRLEGCPVSVAEQVLALVGDRQAQEPVPRSHATC